jgi:hypothetical protein
MQTDETLAGAELLAPYRAPVEDVVRESGVDPGAGLSPEQVEERLQAYGQT